MKRHIRTVRIVLACICLCGCLVAGAVVLNAVISNKRANEIYNDIESNIQGLATATGEESREVIWTRDESPSDELTEPFDGPTVSESEPDQTEAEPGETTSAKEPDGSSTLEEPTESSTPADTKEPVDTEKETGTAAPSVSGMFDVMKAYIISLQEINPDVMGIIHIPMTVRGEDKYISYPVVITDNNDFYLDHDIYGNYLREGSIFADMHNSRNVMDNRNTVLHGHNMFTEVMFHNLKNFSDSTVFHNTMVYFYTTEALYIYEPFAVYRTVATGDYFKTSFSSDQEYLKFLNTCQNNSSHNKNFKFVASDRIMTLSTCLGYADINARFTVQALLVGIEK